jgi:hypothetical protein
MSVKFIKATYRLHDRNWCSKDGERGVKVKKVYTSADGQSGQEIAEFLAEDNSTEKYEAAGRINKSWFFGCEWRFCRMEKLQNGNVKYLLDTHCAGTLEVEVEVQNEN